MDMDFLVQPIACADKYVGGQKEMEHRKTPTFCTGPHEESSPCWGKTSQKLIWGMAERIWRTGYSCKFNLHLDSLYESGIGEKGLDGDSQGKHWIHVRNSRESPDKFHEPGNKAMLFNPAKLCKISKALSAEREETPKVKAQSTLTFTAMRRERRIWQRSRRDGPESQELTGGWREALLCREKNWASLQLQTPQESCCCTVTWLSVCWNSELKRSKLQRKIKTIVNPHPQP